MPAGYVFGLPVGMSIFGGAYKEPELIGIAYAFEQASKVRVAPTLPERLPFISRLANLCLAKPKYVDKHVDKYGIIR